MEREDMTREQELEYVNKLFEEYEEEGFAETFQSPYRELRIHNGKKFKVIGRTKPTEDEVIEVGTAYLEALPTWEIELEDGERLSAYPEEIIPSAIGEVSTTSKMMSEFLPIFIIVVFAFSIFMYYMIMRK